VASDGKISGRGGTGESVAQEHLAQTYRDDFCGATGSGSSEKGEAGNTMVAYDYPGAEKAKATGSGVAVSVASCRTDAFAGTGLPYNKKQLEEMNGAPGVTGGCGIDSGTEKVFVPPFQPNSPTEWPGKEDVAGKVMSFPITGYAVSVPVHLTTASCPGGAPTSLSFTPKELSRILGGDAKEWTEKELTETNSELSKCAGAKITRVVRFDNSGDTSILKSYLARADNARTGAECFELNKEGKTRTWEEYNTSPNTEWPGKGKEVGKEGSCSAITTAAASGGPALVKKLAETEAGVGYVDLADGISEEAKKAGLILASVQNATKTSFQAPNAEKAANCDFKALSLPGVTATESVGLNPNESWATDNADGNHGNATDLGAKYPICGLNWDLVYSGLDNGAVASPISRLSADQRRTLYSYFTFILSSAGQETLSSVHYASLPISWLGTLREGFQSNF
jgi:ABC-type phosphate transport system substrate-binding protein